MATVPRPVHRARVRWTTVASLGLLVAVIVVGGVLVLRPVPALQAAPLAADFQLPAVARAGTIRLSSLRGHTVVLNFFNTNCLPCQQEAATLNRAATSLARRGVVVLGVATLGDTPQAVLTFAHRYGLHFPLAVDQESMVAQDYGVRAIPTSLFIEPRGHLKASVVGPLTASLIGAGVAAAHTVSCPCGPLDGQPTLAQGMMTLAVNGLQGDSVFTATQWAAPPFALIDQNGQHVSLASERGHPFLLTFSAARARELSPLVARILRQVSDQLGPTLARRLPLLSISVDPAGDTRATVARFAANAGLTGRWHLLNGSLSALAPIWRAYGIYVGTPDTRTGDIAYTAAIYLIDAHGYVRVLDQVPVAADSLTADLRLLAHT